MFRTALRFVVKRLRHLDEGTRQGLVESAEHAGGSRCERVLEFSSVVGFALVSWSRWGTGDERTQTVRQGTRFGALLTTVLLVFVAADGGWWPRALSSAALSVAVAGGLVAAAITLAVAVMFLAFSVGGSVVALSAVASVGLVLGRPFDERRCAKGAITALLLLPPAMWLAAMSPALVGVVAAAVVVAFILIGWNEPRFAVAATVFSVATLLIVPSDRLLSAAKAATGAAQLGTPRDRCSRDVAGSGGRSRGLEPFRQPGPPRNLAAAGPRTPLIDPTLSCSSAALWSTFSVPSNDDEACRDIMSYHRRYDVTDILIRDVPDEVLAAIDAKAKRVGLSRTEYLRRTLERERTQDTGPITIDQLRRAANLAADLDDPDVMSGAWS